MFDSNQKHFLFFKYKFLFFKKIYGIYNKYFFFLKHLNVKNFILNKCYDYNYLISDSSYYSFFNNTIYYLSNKIYDFLNFDNGLNHYFDYSLYDIYYTNSYLYNNIIYKNYCINFNNLFFNKYSISLNLNNYKNFYNYNIVNNCICNLFKKKKFFKKNYIKYYYFLKKSLLFIKNTKRCLILNNSLRSLYIKLFFKNLNNKFFNKNINTRDNILDLFKVNTTTIDFSFYRDPIYTDINYFKKKNKKNLLFIKLQSLSKRVFKKVGKIFYSYLIGNKYTSFYKLFNRFSITVKNTIGLDLFKIIKYKSLLINFFNYYFVNYNYNYKLPVFNYNKSLLNLYGFYKKKNFFNSLSFFYNNYKYYDFYDDYEFDDEVLFFNKLGYLFFYSDFSIDKVDELDEEKIDGETLDSKIDNVKIDSNNINKNVIDDNIDGDGIDDDILYEELRNGEEISFVKTNKKKINDNKINCNFFDIEELENPEVSSDSVSDGSVDGGIVGDDIVGDNNLDSDNLDSDNLDNNKEGNKDLNIKKNGVKTIDDILEDLFFGKINRFFTKSNNKLNEFNFSFIKVNDDDIDDMFSDFYIDRSSFGWGIASYIFKRKKLSNLKGYIFNSDKCYSILDDNLYDVKSYSYTLPFSDNYDIFWSTAKKEYLYNIAIDNSVDYNKVFNSIIVNNTLFHSEVINGSLNIGEVLKGKVVCDGIINNDIITGEIINCKMDEDEEIIISGTVINNVTYEDKYTYYSIENDIVVRNTIVCDYKKYLNINLYYLNSVFSETCLSFIFKKLGYVDFFNFDIFYCFVESLFSLKIYFKTLIFEIIYKKTFSVFDEFDIIFDDMCEDDMYLFSQISFLYTSLNNNILNYNTFNIYNNTILYNNFDVVDNVTGIYEYSNCDSIYFNSVDYNCYLDFNNSINDYIYLIDDNIDLCSKNNESLLYKNKINDDILELDNTYLIDKNNSLTLNMFYLYHNRNFFLKSNKVANSEVSVRTLYLLELLRYRFSMYSVIIRLNSNVTNIISSYKIFSLLFFNFSLLGKYLTRFIFSISNMFITKDVITFTYFMSFLFKILSRTEQKLFLIKFRNFSVQTMNSLFNMYGVSGLYIRVSGKVGGYAGDRTKFFFIKFGLCSKSIRLYKYNYFQKNIDTRPGTISFKILLSYK